MSKLTKRSAVLCMIVALIISMSGCSFSNSTSKSNNDTKQTENNKKDDGPKLEQDTKKTEELKKEKQVLNGNVYIQNNVATAAIIIKDDISESDAKALAEKYAKELKQEHKDMKINVQAVQKGKNIANITIEK